MSATYRGALAEERLPRECGLVLWPGRWNFWNDGSIAAGIIRTMVENGSSGEADSRIVALLASRSESLVKSTLEYNYGACEDASGAGVGCSDEAPHRGDLDIRGQGKTNQRQ